MGRFTLLRQSLMVLCFVTFGLGAQAQVVPPIASSSCDPDYYDTLKSRAWLEAQREITQNQNLIFKPDSVLALSCFAADLWGYSTKATSMFSTGVDVSGPLEAAIDFVDASFSGTMLSWRSDIDSTGLFVCDAMAAAWEESQCMNFSDEVNNDGFFTLAEYTSASSDKRYGASCGAPPSGWATESSALENANTQWEEDIIFSFADDFDADGGGCADSKMIETGIQSELTGSAMSPYAMYGQLYNQHICVRNGCIYIPDTEETGQCVSNNS